MSRPAECLEAASPHSARHLCTASSPANCLRPNCRTQYAGFNVAWEKEYVTKVNAESDAELERELARVFGSGPAGAGASAGG